MRDPSELKARAQAARRVLAPVAPPPTTLAGAERRAPGGPLPSPFREMWQGRLAGRGPLPVLHRNREAGAIARAHDAEAITIDRHIFAPPDVPVRVIAHEIVHVAQNQLSGQAAPGVSREAEATRGAGALMRGGAIEVALAGAADQVMPHPAERILLRTGRWLLRRTTRSLTRHIARHGRRIAGRAVHSVFRQPRSIKRLVTRAVREALAVAQRATRHGADDVLEEGGTRIFRQAAGARGKFRTVIERDMGREIGTRGERILRIVIDQSGRIVTAFPVERFTALGIGAVAVGIFDAHTAMAADRIRARVQAEEDRPTDWLGEIIDFFNPISGGSLNEGEDLELDIRDIVEEAAEGTIREIEETERMTLSEEQRQAIRDLAAVGLGVGLEMEDPEEESE